MRRFVCRSVQLVGVVALLLCLMIARNLFDEGPFVAPDLEPVVFPVPPEGNFALLLLDLDGPPEIPYEYKSEMYEFENAVHEESLEEFRHSEEFETFVREIIEPSDAWFEAVIGGLDLPHCEFPPPERWNGEDLPELFEPLRVADTHFDYRTQLASLGTTEEYETALHHQLRFAAQVSRARNGGSIELLLRRAIVGGGEGAAIEWLRTTSDVESIRRTEALLRSIRHDRDDASHALRNELRRYHDFIEDFAEITERDLGPAERFVLLPNRTRRIMGEFLRIAIEEGQEQLEVSTRAAANRETGFVPYLLEGNNAGRALIAGVERSAIVCTRGLGHELTLRDLVRLVFALRIRELETGTLPDSLDALVPEFFEAVPTDPRTGEAYGYDPERRIVWGVGKDRVDDGGVENEKQRGDPDVVRGIPGGE